MGTGYEYTCPKCSYTFSFNQGVGFLFPKLYEEIVTAAKEGKLGEEIRQFFEEQPNGAIDAEKNLAVCTSCGEYESVLNLSMYIPESNRTEDKENQRWSFAFPFYGAKYVAPSDLKENYRFIKAYPHRCRKCEGKMRIIKSSETLLCPICEEVLENTGIIMWD